MMKKWIILAFGAVALQNVHGQIVSQQLMVPDNWFVGAHLGLNTKTTHNSLLSNLNSSFGLRLGYELTPRVGFIGEGTFFFGDSKFGMSSGLIKAYNVDLLAAYNITHAIYGYKGLRRHFEVKFLLGLGINHICDYPNSNNNNDLIGKVGFDLGMNFGKHRQLYVYLQPALNYNLDHYSRTQFNINYSAIQLAVGANYRFTWKELFSKSLFKKRQKKETAEDWLDETVTPQQPAVEIAIANKPAEQKTSKEQKKQEALKEKERRQALKEQERQEALREQERQQALREQERQEALREQERQQAQKQQQSKPAKKVEVTPMQSAQKQQVAEKFAKVDQVGAYLKSHPKAKVVIRGEESQAKEAANQLARRFGISLTRIEVAPSTAAKVTFEIK